MKRSILMVFILLLLPFSTYSNSVNAESNLVYSGVTDSSSLIVYHEILSDNSLLTVTKNGEISQQTLSQGEFNSIWTFQTNLSMTSARLDNNQQLLAASFESGLLVFSISSRQIAYQHNTSNTPDDIDWDNEGNVWIAYYTGARKAYEYNQLGATGFQTGVVTPGFLAFEVLENNEITFSAMDSNTYIYGQDGAFISKLTQSNDYLTYSYQDSSDDLIVGSSVGMLYRYNTTTWTSSSLNLGVSQKITSISYYDDTSYFIGTEDGNVFIVGKTPFTVKESFSGSGLVTGGYREFSGQVCVFVSTSITTQVSYFDIDSDLDGTPDSIDVFPTDSTQIIDSDGDGYGDNLSGTNGDAFPNDATQYIDSDGDGYGDNSLGSEGDLFPQNPDQWQDSDGDGYGDNIDGIDGDVFPNDPTQWNDTDNDGYGDNPSPAYQPDGCPEVNGFSTKDRFGCLDSDFDKYSDPSPDWTISQGADAIPNDITQWIDRDGDGYGENLSGNNPDSCPLIFGTSMFTWQADPSSQSGYSKTSMFGCLDSDGDRWADSSDAFPDDPLEWFDEDGDNVGSNSDYDDTKILVSTEQQYCMQAIDNQSNVCQGWRDPDYQEYLSREKQHGDVDLSYSSWVISTEAGLLTAEEEDGLGETIKQVSIIGGILFVALSALIVLISFISKKRKINDMIKRYGVPFEPEEASANQEALEGSAGLSASGGIDSDGSWDDEVEDMNFSSEEVTEDELEPISEVSAEEIYDQENSLEDIAGIEIKADETSAEEVSAMLKEEDQHQDEKPKSAPPVPETGLPEGWTMEQWEWYGHEWIAKNGGQ